MDTNVFVSGLIAERGSERRIVVAVANGTIDVVVSAAFLTELRSVFERPHSREAGIDEEAATTILARVAERVPVAIDEIHYPVSVRDPKDDYLVKSALAAGGVHLVTRDDDLLVLADDLRPFGVEVVTPAAFVAVLEAEKG